MGNKENAKNVDQTEPVCAPMIRLSATVLADGASTLTNGEAEAEHDETEPCTLAPLVKIAATVPQPDANV